MTRPPKRARSLRVDDALWSAALEAADERGEVLSEVMREMLGRYVDAGTKQPPANDKMPRPIR